MTTDVRFLRVLLWMRANAAARLSAEARDQADDLRKRIAALEEQVAIVEEDRTAYDAWVVNVAIKHGLPDDPATNLDTIARYLDAEVAARKDLSHYATTLERDRTDRDNWTLNVARRHGLSTNLDDPWGSVHELLARIAHYLDELTAERDRLGKLANELVQQLKAERRRPCCDLHGRNCEPPSELCCQRCTEASHPEHADGSVCSAPDLSREDGDG